MGKKNKKSKAERREAHHKSQGTGNTSNTQATVNLSEVLNQAVEAHGGKKVANTVGVNLTRIHQIISNPNRSMNQHQMSDMIGKLETLEAN